MKNDDESPEDSSLVPRDLDGGGAVAAFSPESIQKVRDFTARKTLEQAYAFVTGLLRVIDDAGADDGAILRDLERAGVGRRDADQMADAAVALMELLADRDRKADVFHAAVKEAGQSERALYERLAALARVLRAEIGDPGLREIGVSPSIGEANKPRPNPSGEFIFSAADIK